MNTRNSSTTVHVNTHRVTLSAMDEDTRYPLPTFPEPERTEEDDAYQTKWLRIIGVIVVLAWVSAIWKVLA